MSVSFNKGMTAEDGSDEKRGEERIQGKRKREEEKVGGEKGKPSESGIKNNTKGNRPDTNIR